MIHTFDSTYGDGSLKKLVASATLDDLACTVEEVADNQLRFTWQGERGLAQFSITFTEDEFAFYSYVVDPPGSGILSSLVPPFVAAAKECGVKRFTASPGHIDSIRAFSRLGFVDSGLGRMEVPVERIAEYAEFRHGDADEPDWHKGLPGV